MTSFPTGPAEPVFTGSEEASSSPEAAGIHEKRAISAHSASNERRINQAWIGLGSNGRLGVSMPFISGSPLV
jgi:hypothetical protein